MHRLENGWLRGGVLMAIIFVENARVGMRAERDIYTNTGVKLFTRETVLTIEHLHMMKKHNVTKIEVAGGPGLLSGNSSVLQSRGEKAVLISLFRKIPLFEIFTNHELELLSQYCSLEKVDAQTVLFREKDPGDVFYVILQGSIKIFMQSNSGSEKILTLLQSGDSFGELSLIDGQPRSASAQTLDKTELIIISRENFMKMLETHFDIAIRIIKELIQRIYDTKQHFEDLMFFDASERVIRTLIKLTNRFGKRTEYSIEVEMLLDFNELSQMAGVNIIELQNVLSDLEKKQLLRMHTHYFTLNLLQLRNL
jgi:CRP/FNR family cyclic AMP-dependent transcriptional regulator